MTKRQKAQHKLGNAVRAYRGALYTSPQRMAKSRIEKWSLICKRGGYISLNVANNLVFN